MAKTLMVNCKSCKKAFQSPIGLDEETFKSATLSGNSYQCSACGESNVYDKEDHFFA